MGYRGAKGRKGIEVMVGKGWGWVGRGEEGARGREWVG